MAERQSRGNRRGTDNVYGHPRASGDNRAAMKVDLVARDAVTGGHRCGHDGCSRTDLVAGHIVPYQVQGIAGLDIPGNEDRRGQDSERTVRTLVELTWNGVHVGFPLKIARAIVYDTHDVTKPEYTAAGVKGVAVTKGSSVTRYGAEYDLNGIEQQCTFHNGTDNKRRTLTRVEEVRRIARARYRVLQWKGLLPR